MKNELIIYKGLEIKFDFADDTVWLNRKQISQLFGRDTKTIGKHINNALKEELKEISVVAKFATTATDGKVYQVEHYNLDAILSVGYRVKSNEGLLFRKWANSVLKEHLLKGYTINKNRLKQLNQVINIISRSADPTLKGISKILDQYSSGLDFLDDYDYHRVSKPKFSNKGTWKMTYEEARNFIESMKFGEKSNLFGQERNDSFKSSIGAIYQTFDGNDVYPSVQEKAANLLYLVTKNHSFTDGNKRIAAALFVYFLDKNKLLYTKTGRQIIDNNALAATTLMIALSKPQEKEIMCSLVMSMLKGE